MLDIAQSEMFAGKGGLPDLAVQSSLELETIICLTLIYTSIGMP
jgi:hypothetical protein